MYNGDKARKDMLINYGFRLPAARDNRPLMFHELESKIHQAVYVSATPAEYERELAGGEVVEQIVVFSKNSVDLSGSISAADDVSIPRR